MQRNFSFEYLKQVKELLDIFPHERFEEITQTLLSAYDKGKHIFIMGNGGSGSTASHFVCDINKGTCLELEKKFKSIKILDPACGSGAFLIKSTEILFEVFEKIQFVKENYGEYEASRGLKAKSNFKGQLTFKKWDEKDEIKNIIENNIYGVDINEESVEITKLSLFLKIARKNKKLVDLSNHIKKGNSLIDSE